jgi:sec-independent protein translocase protein TatA
MTLAFINNLFRGWDLIIILGIGLLVFGRRLPEVGRSLGKGIVEFKKGLKGIEDDVQNPPAPPTPPPLPER